MAKYKLSDKQQAFCEHYLACWNASEAARLAGYNGRSNTVGPRLLSNVVIQQAIRERLDALQATADEVLVRLTEQARANIGVFFKVTDEWTEWPLPTAEIIGYDEVPDPDDDKKTKKLYRVRRIVIDLEKLTDPQYSHLVRKFKDSPKDGISLELHDQQSALKLIGQRHGLFKDKLEISGHVDVTKLSDDELRAIASGQSGG